MQYVKIKHSEKPHLKKNAGWFGKAVYKYRVWHDNRRYDYYDRHRRSVSIRLGGLLLIAVGLVGYSAVAPRPSNTVSTKLNTPVPFGNQGKNVRITSRVLNPKTGTLQVGLKFTGSLDALVSDVNMNRFKLTFAGDRYIKSGQSEVNIVPTSDTTMVVQFIKIRTGFQDVRINIKDKSMDTANITAATRVSESSVKTIIQEEQIGTLVVNNDDTLTRDTKQPIDSQKTLVLAQTKLEISDQNKLIKDNQKAIKKWQKAITERIENSRVTRTQMNEMNTEELAQADNLIEANDASIVDFKSNISHARENISSAKDKIKSLQKLYRAQQNGHLNVGKVR